MRYGAIKFAPKRNLETIDIISFVVQIGSGHTGSTCLKPNFVSKKKYCNKVISLNTIICKQFLFPD